MNKSEQKQSLTCGLIMPISELDSYTFEHWAEVKNIIVDAVESIGEYKFLVKMVSDADDVGVIQKRIVQNVYDSDIVVCDVSGKNPNVMFELGMRLAFDKPTIIVKDDKTEYSFDTSVIEHVPYPRDLRFTKVLIFKERLTEKVIATYKASLADPEHSTFLKNFGKFKVSKLAEDEVSPDRLLLELVSEMRSDITFLKQQVRGDTYRTISSDEQHKIARAKFEIEKAIISYMVANNISELSELEASKIEELKAYTEQAVPAHQIFVSRRSYEEAFYDVLLKIGSAESRALTSSSRTTRRAK